MSETSKVDAAGGKSERQARARATSDEVGELARLEQRLHLCWRDLAEAEQRGVAEHLLERMYANYLRVLDAYVALQRHLRGRALQSRLAS